WMVVDDEHAGHDSPPTGSGVRGTADLVHSTGTSTWMIVPFEGPRSMTQLPPRERTRSVMAVRPKPLGVEGAIPFPSSLIVRVNIPRGRLAPLRRGASVSPKSMVRVP